jgi:hypothetical protein
MHIFDLIGILYIIIWIYGALAIMREARWQGNLVRLMALVAIILGPPGMLAYLGLRYLGNALAAGMMLPPGRRAPHVGPPAE